MILEIFYFNDCVQKLILITIIKLNGDNSLKTLYSLLWGTLKKAEMKCLKIF